MAGEARRQGWRVVAFTFGEVPGVSAHAERTIPSRLNEAGVVLAALEHERVGAVLFSGKFWIQDFLRGNRPDTALAEIAAEAGAMVDTNLVQAVVATLGRMDITLLDQRPFLGDWLGGNGCWSARAPTDAEWADVRRGLAVARLVADAIRRGIMGAGVGAVVVKAAARDHDYRFDMPTIGPETIEIATAGGATVVAVEAERVLVLDKEACLRIANGAGMALVGVE